jgi:flagellar M-ring protein FliF
VDRDTGAIRVRSARVAELRLDMAAAGLPQTGRFGFELFDRNNFGVSEFSEQVNFQRAIEGELERSVMTLSAVESARVHVTAPHDSVFLDNRRPAKASVLLRLRPAARLEPQNIQAIAHLVSSAVDGLAPEAVSILDSRGNLLNRARRESASADEADEAILDFQRSMERGLLAKVNATLDPLLGPEKFRAAVTVDVDFASSEQSEETFDPNSSVMAVSQRTDDAAGGAPPGGVPGTASNLPRPAPELGSSDRASTRRTESVTYQTSRKVTRTHTPQGVVRRLSVSVLLDHAVRLQGGQRIVEPPSAEKIETTRALLAGVVGLQPERGDQLVVEALPFEPAGAAEPETSEPQPGTIPFPSLTRLQWTIVAAAGVLLAMAGVLSVVLRRRGKRQPRVSVAKEKAVPPAEGPALGGSSLEDQIGEQIAENQALRKQQEQEMLLNLKLPPGSTNKSEVLVKRLAEETKRDPNAFAQVVRSWMSEADD